MVTEYVPSQGCCFLSAWLVRCVWLKCLTVHCVPFWIWTVCLAALCVFAQCVFVCERWQASPQRYREANCILITKPSNAQVRQLPSTPRKHTVNGAVKCVFSPLLLLILMSHYRRQSVEGNLRTRVTKQRKPFILFRFNNVRNET